MFTVLTKLLGTVTSFATGSILPYLQIIMVGAGVLGFGIVEYKTYSWGYNRAMEAVAATTAREVAREHEANQAALATAYKQITDLQTETDNLNKELSDADVKAAKDFNAKHRAIGSDSVRRLNSRRN